ncbi:MAG: hypothetical protein H8K10_14880 [Nitrospira sp.]|nr:hypothetical protein [Nitrospira sp.]
MQWPEVPALSTIRFTDPECCEEEETELFEEDKTGNILRITIPHHTAVRYTSPAMNLVFGLDKHNELAEIWIRNLVVSA